MPCSIQQINRSSFLEGMPCKYNSVCQKKLALWHNEWRVKFYITLSSSWYFFHFRSQKHPMCIFIPLVLLCGVLLFSFLPFYLFQATRKYELRKTVTSCVASCMFLSLSSIIEIPTNLSIFLIMHESVRKISQYVDHTKDNLPSLVLILAYSMVASNILQR